MPDKETAERINELEELVMGMADRMNAVETAEAEELRSFVKEYKETLNFIASKIETSDKSYDHEKIQHNIDSLTRLVTSVPKTIAVEDHHHHHFGAWSKNLIIGIVVAFLITAGSVGLALYLDHENDRLNSDAYDYWLVKALYPDVVKSVETNLTKDPAGYTLQAERAIAKQQAVLAAQAEAELAGQIQQAAEKKLERARAGK